MTQNLPAKKPIDSLKAMLDSDSVKSRFHDAMGKHADKFTTSLISVFSGDNGLQNCKPAEVVQQALKAAVLNLPIEKNLGFADIIAYKKGKNKYEPSMQIGYKGWIQLAKRSGQIVAMNDGAIYEGEEITVNRLSGTFQITGTPKKNAKAIGYFAYFKEKNGCETMRYWTKEQVIEHAQKYSAGYKAKLVVWVNEFDKMASKTVLTHILKKYAPKSVDYLMSGVEEIDTSSDVPEPAETIVINQEPEKKKKKPEPEQVTDVEQGPGDGDRPSYMT